MSHHLSLGAVRSAGAPESAGGFPHAAPVARSDVVESAVAWIGTPYHHQASVRGIGTDCLGLVRGIWREHYGAEPEPVPNYTRDWAEAFGSEALLDASARHLVLRGQGLPIRAGEVLLFRSALGAPAKHVGVALDATAFVHAVDGRAVVRSLFSAWWKRRLVARFDFPGITD